MWLNLNIPDYLQAEFNRTQDIYLDFLKWLHFCITDVGRDPNFSKNHLLAIISQDYLESIISTPLLISEGAYRPIKREARFIFEMSIKLSYISQLDFKLSIDNKLEKYNRLLDSPGISIMRQIALKLMPTCYVDDFFQECGKFRTPDIPPC